MSLRPMGEILAAARKGGYAVGAFECWNSTSVQAIALASARTGCPVIFQASAAEYRTMGGAKALAEQVNYYVKRYGASGALHLDHGTGLEEVEECLQAGFTSVMLDASAAEWSENVRLSAEAAKMAHLCGASAEAELGHVGGSAEGGIASEESLTDPDKAAEFVRLTKVDCLAVAVGTVHGEYRGTPRLRLDLLKRIADTVPEPLVLHGGSGTPLDQLHSAIRLGIAKINICTDIHRCFLDAIEETREKLTISVPGKFYEPVLEKLTCKVADFIYDFKPQEEK